MLVYPRLNQIAHRLHSLEITLAPGPFEEGVTGGGTYKELYGYAWLLLLDRDDGTLKLYQARESGQPWPLGNNPTNAQWAHWATIPIIHNTGEIKHISLAFDQAARPMIAYERQGAVWVRQWNPVAQRYDYRGPFPGFDPVLVCDASVTYVVPGSDVVLFHLDTARKTLLARLQRDNFALTYPIHIFDEPMYLDQAILYPYRLFLVGSRTSSPQTTDYVLGALYPVHVRENALGSMTGVSALYWPVMINAGLSDGPVAGTGGVYSASYEYVPTEPEITVSATEISAGTGLPFSAAYSPAMGQLQPSEQPIGGTMASVTGAYALGGAYHAFPPDVANATGQPLSVVYWLP